MSLIEIITYVVVMLCIVAVTCMMGYNTYIRHQQNKEFFKRLEQEDQPMSKQMWEELQQRNKRKHLSDGSEWPVL